MEFLYKYVSSERVLTYLPEVGDGTLRATQPSALNDPFECATTKTFIETDSNAGNRRLSAILTNIHDSTPSSAPVPEDRAQDRQARDDGRAWNRPRAGIQRSTKDTPPRLRSDVAGRFPSVPWQGAGQAKCHADTGGGVAKREGGGVAHPASICRCCYSGFSS